MMGIVERLREHQTNLVANLHSRLLANAAADEIERLRAELTSIANNTCCDGCQEAARWARAALAKSVESPVNSNTQLGKSNG